MFAHQKKELKPDEVTGEKLVVSYLIIQTFGYWFPLALTTWMCFAGASPILPGKIADG